MNTNCAGSAELAYAGRTVLVVGAARSGLAAAAFLLRRGAKVTLTDIQTLENLSESLEPLKSPALAAGSLALEMGGHRNESFSRCDLVVASPGVPLSLPCFDHSRKAGIPILSEVELAFRHLRGKLVGITGSNGKTTTTTLVTSLLLGSGLKGHAAGNIGVPLISLAEHTSPDDIYVVELSSFQLEAIHDFRPEVAALLNLTPNHLDRYAGFQAYVEAKRRIFMNQRPGDMAVLNADDPRTRSLPVPSTPYGFSRLQELECGAFVRAGRLIFRDSRDECDLFPVSEIRLKGQHNLENVLAACAIAILAGAHPASLGGVVREFHGIEHRIEWVADIGGVSYYNDSKATSVDAAIKSLESFPGSIHLILGGRDKNGDFSAMQALIAARVKQVVLIGEAASKIRQALANCTEISESPSLEEAVRLCHSKSGAGDTVLFAPACASFDMFRNYEHRGRAFKEIVRSIAAGN